ncbi:hypothetical protein EUX98_g9683, partial [Antrodiella citrinella]
PRRPQAPRNAPPKNTQITPVDAIPSRFDPTKEDIVMEDVSNKPPPARKQPPQPKENQEKGDAVRNTARHSTLSEKVSSSRVIEHALETPVTVTMGQLLGSSKELTQSLMDMLRFKKPVEPAAVSTNLIHTTAPLLRLKMICNGFPVNFVIDSGSEVNLLNHEIAQDIGLPVDERPSVAIKDANGGLGRAVGMIPNVPVSCGHVKTITNFFVAKDIPFDGLLGRPWQSDNLVSIKEKSNGTYLEFPNPDGKTEESKKRSRFDSQPSEDDSGVEEPDSAKKRRQEGPTLDVICGTYQTSAIVDVNSPISLLNQSTWGLTGVLAKTMKGNVLNNKRGTSHTLLGKVTDSLKVPPFVETWFAQKRKEHPDLDKLIIAAEPLGRLLYTVFVHNFLEKAIFLFVCLMLISMFTGGSSHVYVAQLLWIFIQAVEWTATFTVWLVFRLCCWMMWMCWIIFRFMAWSLPKSFLRAIGFEVWHIPVYIFVFAMPKRARAS